MRSSLVRLSSAVALAMAYDDTAEKGAGIEAVDVILVVVGGTNGGEGGGES
jgi:hypothetical protein